MRPQEHALGVIGYRRDDFVISPGVYALGVIGYRRDDFVISPGVAISRRDIDCAVSVATPRCDEGCIVSVFRVEGYTVISIPCIEYRFFLPLGDISCLLVR